MIILQLLRAATIITLVTAGAACWILIIKVDTSRSYFIFECFSLVFTSFACIAFIISELAFVERIRIYLRNTWPILSDSHGVGWLGGAIILIGCNILGTLNQPAYEEGNLNSSFSAVVMAGGILSLIFGVLNIVCGLFWRDGSQGITSRDIRANGSLANSQREVLPEYHSHPSSPAGSVRNEKTRSKFMSMFWKKEEGNQNVARPNISAPFNMNHDVERDAHQDDRASPIIPGLRRPDTALHPMHTGRSSHYSEANMSRF